MNTEIRESIAHTIKSLDRELREISIKIHDDPELGNKEFHAHDLLTDYLEKKGFKVTRKAAGLETAFLAEFSNSSSDRRVGFVCEYDALPGVGHACGHNIITVQGLASALSLKTLMEHDLVKGKVVLFGTPAEESTSGKINFIKTGLLQNSVDVAMMLHPFAKDSLYGKMLALDTLEVEFFGKASHAGMAPWNGINALDALMQSFDNVGLLRQQILPTDRVHGIITNGGKSANVIPDYASAKFMARSVTKNRLSELKEQVDRCFLSAARATGCTVSLKWAAIGPLDDVFMNDAMTATFQHYMEEEGITYPSKAKEEQLTLGSTDMGNFSYVVPSIHPGYGIHTDAANHTKEFAAAAGTEVAHQDTLRAAKCLSLTAAEILRDDKLYEQIVADFKKGKAQ
ncbi:Peptidase M20 domain-containing protein 2 [Choanephora cucurbitarum]|uniref:Peptidase M20 domain-containing protein 2 n=1 Tax=Choanephora cucurbitarum TaxID=101091 RepID=A0A1C7NI93_9FUNG|nr:Peptidase M20 domain-containing protein 2 [Choanephora cucurbitarum]